MKKPIRVANIVPDCRLAGPSSRVFQVAVGLRKRGFESLIVFPEGDQHFACLLAENGIKGLPVSFSRPRHPRNVRGNLLWLLQIPGDCYDLSKLLRQGRIDLIHCNGLLQLTPPLAGKLSGIRTLWHMNDMMVPPIARLLLKRLVLEMAEGLVFSSRAVQRQFGSLPVSFPSKVIYPPVDTQFFEPTLAVDQGKAIRSALGVPSGSPVVGVVANINYAKGVTDFVEAAAVLARWRKDVRFIHIGARLETRRKLYESIANSIKELGLESRFAMVGRRANVRDYLAAMDVFVMPSISEAAGMTLLEAMSMAKAIVATNVGGIPELVRDGREALLVSPRSPSEIAGKVAMFLESPKSGKNMGREARERAIQHFDISRCIEMHETYYRELVEP